MAVEEWCEAGKLEPRHQLVGELGRIAARIGDENLEFFGNS